MLLAAAGSTVICWLDCTAAGLSVIWLQRLLYDMKVVQRLWVCILAEQGSTLSEWVPTAPG